MKRLAISRYGFCCLWLRGALIAPLTAAIFPLGGCALFDGSSTAGVAPPPPAAAADPAVAENPAPGEEPDEDAPPWPRVLQRDDLTFEIHQPQAQEWDGLQLAALSAVSVQKEGVSKTDYGVLKLAFITVVDKAERLVYLTDVEITEALFPGSGDRGATYGTTLNTLLPDRIRAISLDQLEANLESFQEHRELDIPAHLKNDPPRFLFSSEPAMLIMVDGEPAYRPIEGTGLEQVRNTHAVLLRAPDSKHYLHLFDGFLEAPALEGPWTVSSSPPAEAEALLDDLEARGADLLQGQEDPETGKMPSLETTEPPVIHVALSPTELIVTYGDPQYLGIEGTSLEYVENTTANVIRDTSDGVAYVLTSGRWFKAANLDGPWQFVPAGELPGDFARIPDDSPKENIKASIPGTAQAREARIANAIPNMSLVDPEMEMDPFTIDGEPAIEPIPDTSLSYVTNTRPALIRVDDGSWYGLDEGVWFSAGSLDGPWKAAQSVPPAIYGIPPESPLHYVTYVRIYGLVESGEILVGYTPGYYGTVVSGDGTVVYGTGYNYTPYVSDTVYVSYPNTYGCGCDMAWTPWAGWAFGFGIGWAFYDHHHHYPYYGYYPPAPRWGPYGAYWNDYGGTTAWGPGGWAGTTGNVYRDRGDWRSVSRGAGGYNAYSGNEWARQYGRAYNSRTGVQAAGYRGTVNNVYTDRSVSGGRAIARDTNTGQIGSAAGVRGDSGGALRVGDDIYAGRNGNVYQREGGNWSQVTGNSSSAVRDSRQTRSLDQNRQARELSSQRYQSFQSSRPPSGSMQRSYNAGGGMRATGARGGGYRGGGFRGGRGGRR